MAKKKDLKKQKKILALKKAAKKASKKTTEKNVPSSVDLEELLVPPKK